MRNSRPTSQARPPENRIVIQPQFAVSSEELPVCGDLVEGHAVGRKPQLKV